MKKVQWLFGAVIFAIIAFLLFVNVQSDQNINISEQFGITGNVVDYGTYDEETNYNSIL